MAFLVQRPGLRWTRFCERDARNAFQTLPARCPPRCGADTGAFNHSGGETSLFCDRFVPVFLRAHTGRHNDLLRTLPNRVHGHERSIPRPADVRDRPLTTRPVQLAHSPAALFPYVTARRGNSTTHARLPRGVHPGFARTPGHHPSTGTRALCARPVPLVRTQRDRQIINIINR